MTAQIIKFPDKHLDIRQMARIVWPVNRDINRALCDLYPNTTQGKKDRLL